jgi:uncharacterized protein YfcZ (UPF0381/DUF406 family)
MKIEVILSSISKLYAKREGINKQIADLQKKIAAEAKAVPARVKPAVKPIAKRVAKPKKPV